MVVVGGSEDVGVAVVVVLLGVGASVVDVVVPGSDVSVITTGDQGWLGAAVVVVVLLVGAEVVVVLAGTAVVVELVTVMLETAEGFDCTPPLMAITRTE